MILRTVAVETYTGTEGVDAIATGDVHDIAMAAVVDEQLGDRDQAQVATPEIRVSDDHLIALGPGLFVDGAQVASPAAGLNEAPNGQDATVVYGRSRHGAAPRRVAFGRLAVDVAAAELFAHYHC